MIVKYLKYLFAILFFIPVYFFLLSEDIGVGIQWSFFRYQITYFGPSVVLLTRDVNYILSGVIQGRSAVSVALLILSTVVLVIAFLCVLSNRPRASGLLTIFAGICALSSCMFQYSVLFVGPAGTCIPFGAFFLILYGFLLFTAQPEPLGENLLKKYDYVFLLIGIFLVYSTYLTPVLTNDTIPSQLLPYYLLHDHTVYLDGATSYVHNYYYAYRFVEVGNGHVASLFPIVTPVLVTPLYAIPILILNIPMTDTSLLAMGRISASLIAAFAGMFVYLACRYLTTRKIALLSAVIFAFATSTWSVSSQTLYAHGMAELLLAVMMFLVVRNESRNSVWNIVGMGICSGLFVFNRPSDAVLVIPIIAYVCWYYRAQAHYYVISGILAGAPFLLYNLILFHHPLGGYAVVASRMALGVSVPLNYLGQFIAPNKGLLIFSPVLILAIFGFWSIRGRQKRPIYRVMQWAVIAIVLNILTYALFDDWIGGQVFGPRYLTGILPFLAFGICIFLDNLFKNPINNLKKMALTFLIIISIVIQFIGAFYYPTVMENPMLTEKNYDPWSTGDSIIIFSIIHGDLKADLQDISFNETMTRLAGLNQTPGKKIFPVGVRSGAAV